MNLKETILFSLKNIESNAMLLQIPDTDKDIKEMGFRNIFSEIKGLRILLNESGE